MRVLPLLVLPLALLLGQILPAYLQSKLANFIPGEPLAVSERALALHQSSIVIDLHADPLFVPRDLNVEASMSCGLLSCTRSHVDVPRLIRGNMALQVFTAFTYAPLSPKIDGNSNQTVDFVCTAAAMVNFWPVASWSSWKHRALYQAEKLHRFAAEGPLRVITTRKELESYIQDRENCLRSERGPNSCDFTGGLLGIEGSQAVEPTSQYGWGGEESLEELFRAGFRLIGLQHFFDNEAGGSAHGEGQHGLTAFGRGLIGAMERRGIVLDLAHSSPTVVDDALDIVTKPFFVSHSGARGVCNNNRTLTDDQILRIAAKGGVIGVGYWEAVTCGRDVTAIARSARYIADVAGVNHVALGSDWDGATSMPPGLDAAGIAQVTEALLQVGFSEEQVRLILGQNALNVLRAVLQ